MTTLFVLPLSSTLLFAHFVPPSTTTTGLELHQGRGLHDGVLRDGRPRVRRGQVPHAAERERPLHQQQRLRRRHGLREQAVPGARGGRCVHDAVQARAPAHELWLHQLRLRGGPRVRPGRQRRQAHLPPRQEGERGVRRAHTVLHLPRLQRGHLREAPLGRRRQALHCL